MGSEKKSREIAGTLDLVLPEPKDIYLHAPSWPIRVILLAVLGRNHVQGKNCQAERSLFGKVGKVSIPKWLSSDIANIFFRSFIRFPRNLCKKRKGECTLSIFSELMDQ